MPAQSASLAAFNNSSLEFFTQSVREGQIAFGSLWDLYQAWESQAVSPTMTMIQSCPPDQLSYGYGYSPLNALLPATVAFAQSFYPYMRFGLTLTLMGNGFFGFDFGDEAPPVAWWYDEYNFNLGSPIGPPALISEGQQTYPNLITNGGFEDGLTDWQSNVYNDGQGKATVIADPNNPEDGNFSAHITIITPGTVNWHIDLEQDNLALTGGANYLVQFWARADSPRVITVFSQGGAPNYPNYGLDAQISIGTSWALYSASFIAATTATDGRLEFWVGDVAGNVWLDDVQLSLQPPSVYRRDFTNGLVLLNGTNSPQTIPLESGFKRFTGNQAPLYQYIVDDSDSGFSSTGPWNVVTYNTGAYSSAGSSATLPAEPQNANGPYYHCWEGSCHELDSGSGSAQWNLNIPADGEYTIQVWLPAAPGAANWTKDAIYEVVSNGATIGTYTLDQSTAAAGDAVHMIGTLNLTAAGAPSLQVHNGGSGPLLADAVYVTSSARYSDGSSVSEVTLGPYDGILLQRDSPATAVTVTIQTVPPGLQFTVDGEAPQTAPQTLTFASGPHTIAVAATQSGSAGTQYVFASWSDGGAASHSISVGSTAATYTATFTTRYLLTTAVSPAGSGTVSASPSSAGYYNLGTNVQLTASANTGYQFNDWTGDISGSTNPQSIAMNAPHSVTANFNAINTLCSLALSAPSANLPPTGTSTVETCPNNSGQPNCGVSPETPMSFTVTPSAACGAWTATSSNPEFLQITSGASGSGAGSVGFALLNNTHNGQQSYTITVASGSASASYAITEAGSGDNQVYREVYALYEQLLGRDPDPAGFAFWTGSGGAGLGKMADSFLTSPEAFNSGFAVMAAYQAATGGPPTYAQFTAAVASVRAGAQTVGGLFNALMGSSFTATNLYQNLLNRAPTAADSRCTSMTLANCFQNIIGYPAPNISPVGAANNEFQSTGIYQTTLAADHTNALYVQMIYYVTLSRNPDPAGYAFWLSGVADTGGPGLLFQGNTGYPTRIQIMGPGTPGQGFIGSPEFQGLFAN